MDKKNNFINKHQKLFYLAVFICFIALELFFTQYHEHWADEAQSWLIARDSSFIDILKYIKYEGTPPLWVFIIKVCINLGLTYNYFSIISFVATSIGIYLLLFKTDFPWYVKLLFPFTYPVFYQTTIVVRSYCLVFPALMMIYLNYEKRFEKPIRFFFILLFFMSISLHTYVIAGSIFAIYLYDFWKLRKEKNEIILKNIKIITTSIVLIFSAFLVILIMLFPDQYMGSSGTDCYSLLDLFGEATFSYNNTLISFISCIPLVIMLFLVKDLEKIIKIIAVLMPLIALYIIVGCLEQHLPILFLLIFFFVITNLNNKLSKIYIVCLLLIEIFWNINTVKFDYYNDYDSSKKIVTFLEAINFEEKEIHAINYHVVSLQPYFEKNIFDNYGKNSDKSYYVWRIDQGYDETLNNLPDLCIFNVIAMKNISNGSLRKCQSSAETLLEHGYSCYSFPGYHYYKYDISEIDNFIVFVSPEVNQYVDKNKYKEYTMPESYFSK